MLCCGYTLTDFPISIRLTSLALWQSNDCPSASKATLMNMDKYFTWIHYERLHNHNKAKHNKTVCIFLGIYCIWAEKAAMTHSDIVIARLNIMTSSNGNISGLLALCAKNSPVTEEFPSQRPLHVLWRHCNEYHDILYSLALTDLEQISHFEFNTDTLLWIFHWNWPWYVVTTVLFEYAWLKTVIYKHTNGQWQLNILTKK